MTVKKKKKLKYENKNITRNNQRQFHTVLEMIKQLDLQDHVC